MNIQKAIIVRDQYSNSNSTQELQRLLADGWVVVNTCAMPSSGEDRTYPTCLVVLEKKEIEAQYSTEFTETLELPRFNDSALAAIQSN